MVKAFNLPIDYVLYEMSYPNMILYSASLPSFKKPPKQDGKTDNSGAKQETINAGDPNNKDKVRALLDSIG